MSSSNRIKSLDALRGLAASAVVLFHFNLALGMHWPKPIGGALYVLLGRLPVAIFFALSGYVLALSFFPESTLSSPAFLMKRILRIYVPYLAAAALASLAYGAVTNASALGTVLMSGTPAGVALNPPFWSLVIEMRFSLLFPLLVALVGLSWRASISSSILVALIASWFMPLMAPNPLQPTVGFTFASSFVVCAYYAPLFVGGILLARHKAAVERVIVKHKLILWGAATVLTCLALLSDMAILVAPVLIVALIPHTTSVATLFRARAIVWLGKVSYSLYLLHGVVLLTMLHYLGSRLVIAILFIPILLLVVEICYRTTELPSVRLGGALASSIDGLLKPRRVKVETGWIEAWDGRIERRKYRGLRKRERGQGHARAAVKASS